MIDIREHGGIFGEGKYRKGSEIFAGYLKPASLPKTKANFQIYIQSSTGLSGSYDNAEDILLITNSSYSSSNLRFVNSKTLEQIKVLSPSTDYSGNIPSKRFWQTRVYRAARARYYATYNTYSSGIEEVQIQRDTDAALIATLTGTGIDIVLKLVNDYVVYYHDYANKIEKIDLINDIKTTIKQLNSGDVIQKVFGWDKFIVKNGSTSYLHNLEGIQVGTISSAISLNNGLFYHAPTNTIKAIGFEYGSSGGHFFYTWNADTFVLVSRVRLSTYASVSVGMGQAYFHSKTGGLAVEMGDANGVYYTVTFRVKSDGTLDDIANLVTTGWFNFNKIPSIRCGTAITSIANDGLVNYEGETSNQYYYFPQKISPYFTLEG
ncbi:hypothetical protein [Fictibacillus phosphorivorans]|uniref:hypothetical protein n=1 Tax=Fictibacillus phosphorivorans TaxID=1221500 RepID=UPI0011A42DF0|nr:hypothetical protein [Fictibacillus phosphorivorans]